MFSLIFILYLLCATFKNKRTGHLQRVNVPLCAYVDYCRYPKLVSNVRRREHVGWLFILSRCYAKVRIVE